LVKCLVNNKEGAIAYISCVLGAFFLLTGKDRIAEFTLG